MTRQLYLPLSVGYYVPTPEDFAQLRALLKASTSPDTQKRKRKCMDKSAG